MPAVEPTMSRRDQRRSSSASTGIGRATAALTAGRQALRRPPKGQGGISAGPPAGAGTASVATAGGPAAGPSGPTGEMTLGGTMPGVSVQPRMPPPTMIAPPMPGGPGVMPGNNVGMRPMLPEEPAVGGPGGAMRAITGGGLQALGPGGIPRTEANSLQGGAPNIQAIMQKLQALGIGPGLGSVFPGLGVGGTAVGSPGMGYGAGFQPDMRDRRGSIGASSPYYT